MAYCKGWCSDTYRVIRLLPTLSTLLPSAGSRQGCTDVFIATTTPPQAVCKRMDEVALATNRNIGDMKAAQWFDSINAKHSHSWEGQTVNFYKQ